jgi:hypothetical protein
MKKCFAMVVSVLWVTGSVSMAQITNPIPYADTYESDKYAAGSNLVGTVWQGVTGTSLAVVTNLTYTPTAGYPVTNANHFQVMAFSDGPITNEFNGTSLTTVALDTMIKPMFAEPPSGSQMAAVSNSQVSLYIGTNGYVNVYHGVLASTIPGTPDSTQWTELTSGAQISSGSWCRLTLVMNYDTSVAPIAMFKVLVNGNLISAPNGYPGADVSTGATGGPWFISPKWDDANLALHRIVLSGSGMLDDMVVTTNSITYAAAEQYATNGVPIQWMLDRGMNTNGTYTTYDQLALGDWDNDGAPTWTERLAGTDPTNETSKLVIISSTIVNGFPVLKWIGTTNAMNPYNIQWSSNLTIISGWTTITSGLPRGDSTHSTNEVTLPAAPYTPAFLRVTVTN